VTRCAPALLSWGMAFMRVVLGMALLGCSACISNTIELETAPASDATSGDGSTTGPGDVPSNPTVGTRTTTAPSDESDSSPPDPTGPFLDIGGLPPTEEVLLLAVSTVVDPTQPIQGIVWLERGGEGTVNIELQWLSLDQGSSTEPRELVGDVYAYMGIPVALDGAFVWSTGVILVPGAANPITGSDIVASMDVGAVPSGSPYCGSVGGIVMSPIEVSLEGSTHAMTSVPSVDALPLEFPVSCE
jgi:hypothetical protein